MNFDRVEQALTRARFHCHRFATGQDAAQWLAAECSGKTVGIGGSMTAKAMKLEELLPRTSTVYWHWLTPGPETLANAATAQVYLTSVNALAETGELINIDGTGNRISAATGAHERVYYLVGRNKLAETFDKALWRARNIASPLNARRLNRETPCVKNELKCYDCNSPQRICNGLSVGLEALGRGAGDPCSLDRRRPGLLKFDLNPKASERRKSRRSLVVFLWSCFSVVR